MTPEQRRFFLVVIISVLFLVSSWIGDEEPSRSSKGIKLSVKAPHRRAGKPTSGISDQEAHTKKKSKADNQAFDEDFSFFLVEEDGDEEAEEEEGAYANTFKGKSQIYIKTSAFHFDLHACLPKFICEIHAHAFSSDLTELEKDIIGLFRNYVILEGPSSPVYTYQLAAHMGQLVTGLEPSPCRELYPSCPLSRPQLLDILRNIKTSRRMFY
ncbi:hypothetical protein SK128_004240 [Halocaridina rubra]|uniref:Uncharacterized protein n=1 Tax=Halocaridina rubra TaxID=373956 RepID=A0AAN8WXT6_HALRR